MPAEDLQAAQLVARTGDGLRFVDAIDAHHLELTYHCKAEEGDRGADAGITASTGPDRLALVKQLRVAAADADIELQRVQNARRGGRASGQHPEGPVLNSAG